MVQSFMVKDPLPALTSLALHNGCEIMDAKSSLQSMLFLRVAYDTLDNAYHGEWWSNITALRTKCPCHVSLGVAGQFPERLEVLFLHTECPEPVSVSTALMTNQPKAYPHQVGPHQGAVHRDLSD